MFEFLIALIILIPTASFAELEGDRFHHSFVGYLENPQLQPSAEEIANHEKTIFIFVAGLYGKYIPGYYKHSIKTVHQQYGQANSQALSPRTFLITPSSRASLSDNTDYVEKEISKIIESAPPGSRFIIEGHSMGAVEVWASVMRHPEWLKSNRNKTTKAVVGVLLPQGVFGGTPLPTFVLGGKPVGSVIPFFENPHMNMVGNLMVWRYRHSPPAHPMLISLTQPEARGFTATTEDRWGAGMNSEMRNHFLFYDSSVPVDESWWKYLVLPSPASSMNVCGTALTRLGGGANDGLVPRDAHVPPGWGDRLQTFGDGTHHLKPAVDRKMSGAFTKAKFSIDPRR